MKRIETMIAVTLLMSVGMATSAAAQTFAIGWHTVDGGGEMSSSGGAFSLAGTVGQPDAGTALAGGSFSLSGGFWVDSQNSCPADLDFDGSVGQSDLGILLAAFGTCPGQPGYHAGAGALGGDPCVTQSDLGVLLANYGIICP
jgi:hypothetical protein